MIRSMARPMGLSSLRALSTLRNSMIDCSKVVEKGVARVLTNVDGNENPYVFTWSDEANTIVERDFDKNTFQIFATRDIQEGDELRHVYKSKEWRNCFASLNIIM